MKARCYNENHKSYIDYGGRGIAVCDEWLVDFSAFFRDMGNRPGPEYSIDRKDCNGNYCKDNCRWATQKEQTRNTRRSKTITVDGITKTVAEWSEITGVPDQRIYKRLGSGIDGADAIHRPIYSRQ